MTRPCVPQWTYTQKIGGKAGIQSGLEKEIEKGDRILDDFKLIILRDLENVIAVTKMENAQNSNLKEGYLGERTLRNTFFKG